MKRKNPKNKRVKVSLGEWSKFEQFTSIFPQIEEVFYELQNLWESYVETVSSVGEDEENIQERFEQIASLFEDNNIQIGFENHRVSSKVVEVIIEDISDGDF